MQQWKVIDTYNISMVAVSIVDVTSYLDTTRVCKHMAVVCKRHVFASHTICLQTKLIFLLPVIWKLHVYAYTGTSSHELFANTCQLFTNTCQLFANSWQSLHLAVVCKLTPVVCKLTPVICKHFWQLFANTCQLFANSCQSFANPPLRFMPSEHWTLPSHNFINIGLLTSVFTVKCI